MSPDIEWRVGEDAEQETIAKITSDKAVRWRKPLVILVAALGLGLGVLYASIPEPTRPSAPVSPNPIATPLPPVRDLAQTIDQESRALANGDMQIYLSLLDIDEYAWRQEQISNFSPWDAPPSNDQFYRIIAIADRSGGQHAWADVVQYRDGKFFRETRFYRWRGGAWVRTRPVSDPDWWGDEAAITTRYFQLTYTAADEEPARLLAGYLARQSRETCRIFDCNFDERPPVVNIVLQADLIEPQQRGPSGSSTLTVTLPSPRVTGYYTADFSGVDIDDEHWDQYFDQYLYFPLLLTAVGGLERINQEQDGLLYLLVIGLWDRTRRDRAPLGNLRFPYRSDLITGTLDLSADEMWQWPFDLSEEAADIRLARACALVQFLDETYGADTVLRFFRTLRFAQSLPHALSRLGMPYEEVEAQWQAWLSRRLSQPSSRSN